MQPIPDIKEFRGIIRRYYRSYGRHLPWRDTRDPYRIMVSEVMLQQTQVPRVLGKYRKFLNVFPSLRALHRAPLRKVLGVWQGLGYNRRALSLKKAAAILFEKHGGRIPKSEEALRLLPGIGPATASAILAFAYNTPTVFIETNIRRVFIHFFFSKEKHVEDEKIRDLVEKTIDRKNPREWYWALMDYGSMLGGLPDNPNKRSARYRKQSPFRGSHREVRGRVLAALLGASPVSEEKLAILCGCEGSTMKEIIRELEREGFVRHSGHLISVR